jgi:hypothetical protein
MLIVAMNKQISTVNQELRAHEQQPQLDDAGTWHQGRRQL